MAAEILRTRYGRPATDALAGAVQDLQGSDPLAPVTIVVDNHATGLMVRRRLAARAGGLAAVDVVTLLDLARSLSAGSPRLTGRRPVSDAVVLAARDSGGTAGSGTESPSAAPSAACPS